MEALTPAERRGALLVVLLLALGAGRDVWRATRPLPLAHALSGAAAVAASPGQEVPPAAATQAPGGGGSAAVPLDLNRASVQELDALPGIGPVLAERIVAYRERHGPFRAPEELRAVRGIGPRLLARLRPRVEVRPVGVETPAPLHQVWDRP